VRLCKAGQSVRLFGLAHLFDSLQTYAQRLLEQGWAMEYSDRDLRQPGLPKAQTSGGLG
jgi:hypothetical protein